MEKILLRTDVPIIYAGQGKSTRLRLGHTQFLNDVVARGRGFRDHPLGLKTTTQGLACVGAVCRAVSFAGR